VSWGRPYFGVPEKNCFFVSFATLRDAALASFFRVPAMALALFFVFPNPAASRLVRISFSFKTKGLPLSRDRALSPCDMV
jgi:hypothetical protein